MPSTRRTVSLVAALALIGASSSLLAAGPFEGGQFKGRIAYSCDGNHNDPDDWIASPVVLAIFAESGVKDRLVHFDYNCILPQTDPEWEKIHAESVLGTAERYGYDLSVFHDCRKDADAAVNSIARAIDASSADNPLYFIVAGPMQVPFMGIEKSEPAKRKHVYCISHSRWNDGYASKYKFPHTKRSVIPSGVRWIQIKDQNPLLSLSRYGKTASPEDFQGYFWMRDSDDPKVRYLWERMLVSTRPDPSDAGMAYFLVTGDEQADPVKLERLLDKNEVQKPISARNTVRLEAENFVELRGFEPVSENGREVSHRLSVGLAKSGETTASGGRRSIRTRFDEPYAADGRYDIEVRYFDARRGQSQFALSVNGKPVGEPWRAADDDQAWHSHTLADVPLSLGDEIAVEVQVANGEPVKLDYLELDARPSTAAASDTGASATAAPATAAAGHSRFTATGPLDDPAALPGQIIVAGGRPGYLKYNGGGTAYLCGPDNPEEFLFVGELQPDGTRRGGPQEEVIEFVGQSGASAVHFQMLRMRRCNIKDEGDDTHCPFVDHDPSKPLSEKVLDQWDGWLKALEEQGVVVHLEFYNDATDVTRMGWVLDAQGNLHPHEKRWIAGIVNRFKERRNIIWGIAESANKMPRERVAHFKKTAELIATTDDHHHPIAQSLVTLTVPDRDAHPDGVTSDEYAGDPNIDIVTWLHLLPHGSDLEAQHREYLRYARLEAGRFIAMKNETHHHNISRPVSRQHAWACALAGMHALEAQHNATRADRRDRIVDDGKVATFMEQTDWHTMQSHDEMAAGSTRWILADPGRAYIAYSYDCSGPIGVFTHTGGTYDLLWFDTVSGRTVRQEGVSVEPGDALWDKPEGLGKEIALYVRRAGAK